MEEDLPIHGPGTQHVFPPKKDGPAIYKYKNPYFAYIGEWKNGKKEGHGKFTLGDDSYYEGDFTNGEITGFGTRYFENGNLYVGEFKKGEYDGRGTFTDAVLGEQYEGEWKDNKRNGEGVLTFSDGSQYVGHFLNHKRDGHGQYRDTRGNFYVGQWKNNMIDGEGQLTYENGDVYIGEFKKGKRDGWGTMKWQSTNLTFTGDWKEDTSTYDPVEFIIPNLPPIIPGATLNNVKILINGGKGESGRVIRVSIEIGAKTGSPKKQPKSKKAENATTPEPQYLIVDHRNNLTYIDLTVTNGIAILSDVVVPPEAEQTTYTLNVVDQSEIDPLPPFSDDFIWMTSAERAQMKTKTKRAAQNQSEKRGSQRLK